MGQFSGTEVGAVTDGDGAETQFSVTDAAPNDPRPMVAQAREAVADLFNAPGKLNWWHKSVGTQYNLAQRSPNFKRVFDRVQDFLNDVNYHAIEAADLAPNIFCPSWTRGATSSAHRLLQHVVDQSRALLQTCLTDR